MLLFRLALVALLAFAACGPHPAPGRGGARVAADPLGAAGFVERIDGPETWQALAYRPEYQTSARTEVVKLLIDRQDGWRTYFVQSGRWELHYGFARRVLGFRRHGDPYRDHLLFNVEQYRRPARRFILASLVRYLDADVWSFELAAGDTLDAENLARAFHHIRQRVFFGDALRFRPLSPRQERHARALRGSVPLVDLARLAAQVRYQPLVTGTAYGYLRVVRGPLDVSALRPSDVVVSEHVPAELPPVSALVTARLQAPLAHVAILCRNRGTPDMALRDATEDTRILGLEGRLVKLVVGPQDFALEPASRAEAERAWRQRRPDRVVAPPLDTRESELREVCRLRVDDTPFAGAKAAQLGEVCALGVETPGGFVVPVAHYLQHLRAHGLDRALVSMLVDPTFQTDAGVRATRLAELRRRIEGASVDRRLLEGIRRRLRASPGRWILRSSTNAEDLPGFNGAGLYESVVVDADASEAEIGRAVARVWASVWLQRAFEERDWFRIEPTAVAMAVLVQPYVDEVVATGVALTANPFDEARPGFYVNLEPRGGSVTGAGDDELPEQVLIYTWSESPEFEVISRSSRTGGAPILSEEDLGALAALLGRLHDGLVSRYGGQANAADVEFLLTQAPRRFVVVQARPIEVRRTPGQGWRSP